MIDPEKMIKEITNKLSGSSKPKVVGVSIEKTSSDMSGFSAFGQERFMKKFIDAVHRRDATEALEHFKSLIETINTKSTDDTEDEDDEEEEE